jgi:hypothetical protein
MYPDIVLNLVAVLNLVGIRIKFRAQSVTARGWGTRVGFPWEWFEIQIREFEHIFEASFFQSNA